MRSTPPVASVAVASEVSWRGRTAQTCLALEDPMRLLGGGRANRRSQRHLRPQNLRRAAHAENVGFIKAWHRLNAGDRSSLRVSVPVLSEHNTSIVAASSTADSRVGNTRASPEIALQAPPRA